MVLSEGVLSFCYFVSFSRGACGALLIKGGGNRPKTVGLDNGFDGQKERTGEV